MVEHLIRDAIEKLNEKRESDEKVRAELEGLDRTIMISLTDGRIFNFAIENGHLSELRDGAIQNPDISIESDAETLEGIFKGEIGAMKALALKRIRVNASIQDMLRIRKLF
ncbi:MAG TPA: hypothetical protein ENN25_01690 [Euryarchaeota archaeon]|nr:hypothetical protein [Euryarchaeota archaeon]